MEIARNDRVAQQLREIAAEFIARNTNGMSLITVTSAKAVPSLRAATFFVTVMPQSQTDAALAFLKRSRSDFRGYMKQRLSIKQIPFIDFAIDEGELRRQGVDEALNRSGQSTVQTIPTGIEVATIKTSRNVKNKDEDNV
jgi:ribosome-binding factor A